MLAPILADSRASVQSRPSFVPGHSSGSLLKMSEAARLAGVSVELLRYYAKTGVVECERTIGGHRLVKRDSLVRALGLNVDDGAESEPGDGLTVIRARVSTDKQAKQSNLVRQVDRLKAFCAEHFPGVEPVVIASIASGLNHEHKDFRRLLDLLLSGKVKRLVYEYKDRVSRNSFAIVERLCQHFNVEMIETRPVDGVTDEDRQHSESEDLAFEVLSVMTCMTARHNGKRGSLVNKMVVSDDTRTRIVALHETGRSYREICRVIKTEGHIELNRGRTVREHNIRSILLAYAKDRRKAGSDNPKPQTVETFVARHCETGPADDATFRVFCRPLYLAYVQFCTTEGHAALSRVEFSKAFQAVTGCPRQRHSTKRDFYAGIKLPACPRSAITHKATP